MWGFVGLGVGGEGGDGEKREREDGGGEAHGVGAFGEKELKGQVRICCRGRCH